MVYYSAIKRLESWYLCQLRKGLKFILLREMSQEQKDKFSCFHLWIIVMKNKFYCLGKDSRLGGH